MQPGYEPPGYMPLGYMPWVSLELVLQGDVPPQEEDNNNMVRVLVKFLEERKKLFCVPNTASFSLAKRHCLISYVFFDSVQKV